MEAFQALMRLIFCGSAHPLACATPQSGPRALLTLAVLAVLLVLWFVWWRTGRPVAFGYVMRLIWLPMQLFWGLVYLPAALLASPLGWVVIVGLMLRYLALHVGTGTGGNLVDFLLIPGVWRLKVWCAQNLEQLKAWREWYPRPLHTAIPRPRREPTPVVVPALTSHKGRYADEMTMIRSLPPHLQRLILQERRPSPPASPLPPRPEDTSIDTGEPITETPPPMA
ncbi:hypothetical protein SAMN02949497_0330 [Methylomagnum ishizawai]|uniref:Uncharacterized protein n=1 Tax=Methylomagnum ishizawai TaxID=1760988 RepID=A0A1Y6DCI7_9GAMM|nr:hypothetical protein [Methylomagnum ishizawai]SMF97932.1 hypothetical protein SAMN02949497_0330 [Methylomagnum ishizawai]